MTEQELISLTEAQHAMLRVISCLFPALKAFDSLPVLIMSEYRGSAGP